MTTIVSATAETFTSRQVEVIRLVAQGATQKGIAVALGIGERTAKQHVDNLRRKLRVGSYRQLPLAYMAATGDSPYPQQVAS